MEQEFEDLFKRYGGRKPEIIALDKLAIHPKVLAAYGQRDIDSLAFDIRNELGMLQVPIAVRTDSKLLIIVGSRRYLAVTLAGWTHVPIHILENVPEEELDYIIVCSNKQRDKTPKERYHELKILERELPKRQGQKPTGDNEPYDQRKELVKHLGGKEKVSEALVRDLMVFDEKTEHLLDSIDNKNVFLTPLATAVRSLEEEHDYTQYVPVEEISLESCHCPFCNTLETGRIELRDGELFYI